MKKLIQYFFLWGLVLVFSSACSFESEAQNVDLQPKAFPTANQTLPPTIESSPPAPSPTQTSVVASVGPKPVPTLTNLQQQLMLLKLNDDNDCVLPCYLGITIEETSLSEALQILQSFGATLAQGSPYIHNSGLKHYNIKLDILDEGIELRQSIFVLSQGEKIIRLKVGIESRNFPEFADYWSRFFVDTVLSHINEPEYIFLETTSYQPTYTIYVIDEEQNFRYSVTSLKNNEQICPINGSDVRSLGFTVHNPEYIDLISKVDNWLNFNPQDYTPLKDVIALSEQEFVSQVLNGTVGCFEDPE